MLFACLLKHAENASWARSLEPARRRLPLEKNSGLYARIGIQSSWYFLQQRTSSRLEHQNFSSICFHHSPVPPVIFGYLDIISSSLCTTPSCGIYLFSLKESANNLSQGIASETFAAVNSNGRRECGVRDHLRRLWQGLTGRALPLNLTTHFWLPRHGVIGVLVSYGIRGGWVSQADQDSGTILNRRQRYIVTRDWQGTYLVEV